MSPIDETYRPPAKWPRVVGVFSLLYAIGGMLCVGGMSAMALLAGPLMKLGGMEVETPLLIKLVAAVTIVLVLALGVMLIVGAIGTLRHRRSGVAWIRRWVVLRLLLLVFGVGLTMVTAQAQMDFQREMAAAQGKDLTDEQLWRQVQMALVMGGALPAIYPTIVGFFLSGRRAGDEIATWD